MYDFSFCKLCDRQGAAVKYRLPQLSLYACPSCDFHYSDVLDEFPPDQPEQARLTESAQRYIESKLPQNTSQLKTNLRFVQTHIQLPGLQCLDIGSGAGVFPALLQNAGAVAEGIEPQQVFREFAQKKFQLALKPEPVDAACWQNGYASYFDLVTLWDTLEHVNFPAATLQAAAKLIRPGGLLLLDTPSRDSFVYRASEWAYRISQGAKPMLLRTLYSAKPYGHKQIFTRAQLQMLLEGAGFSVVGHSALHRSRSKLVVACRKGS